MKTFLRIAAAILITAASFGGGTERIVPDKPETAYHYLDKQGCTYLVNKNTRKRHNASCRWYKNCRGFCTDELIGIACKICGG